MHRLQNLPGSIITKLIFMNIIILFAVGGVVIVSLFISRQTGGMLFRVIDKDLSRVIKNAELSRNLNAVFADTHFLLNTFIEQQDILDVEGKRLSDVLRRNIAMSRWEGEVRDSLESFKQALEDLLEQCRMIITISQNIQTIEDELETTVSKLEDQVADLLITRKIAGQEYELFSLEQVIVALPDYRNLLLQIAIRLTSSKQAYLATFSVEVGDEEEILILLEELQDGLTSVLTIGDEVAPFDKQLIANVQRYERDIILLHDAMKEFRWRLENLDNAQNQVSAVIKHIDKAVILATGNIREEVGENIQASNRVTLLFSGTIIVVLVGVGAYGVSLTRPILDLTASATEIASGNLDAPIDTSAKDEIGRLARSFEHMRNVLKKEMEALAEKNVVLLQEISERQRIEKALRASEERIKNQNTLLEQAVQEKQKEMEALFERLLRQQKLAAIGQIAGSIAHELRNPLGAVKQSIFYLTRSFRKGLLESSSPKVQEHLELIEAEIDTSERVISDLLQMTRRKPVKKEYIDLQNLVLDAVHRCHLPEHIHLTLTCNPSPFVIWADSSQLRQVFINLLTNIMPAIEGEGNITITAAYRAEEAASVIEVIDTGVGIETEALKNVFEPLYTTKPTGTGLGLSICKQIIENHDGQISIKSRPGQGTIVMIVLPEQMQPEARSL